MCRPINTCRILIHPAFLNRECNIFDFTKDGLIYLRSTATSEMKPLLSSNRTIRKLFEVEVSIATNYLLSLAIARTSAKTQTSCNAFLSLFRTESHGQSDDWNASLLSESDFESSVPSSFLTSASLDLLKSIFWAYFARLSESVRGLKDRGYCGENWGYRR